MSLEILNSNLMQSKKITDELAVLNYEAGSTKIPEEKEFFNLAAQAMLKQLDMINNSIPNLVNGISLAKQATPETSVEMQIPTGVIILNKEYRRKFIDELRISEEALKRLKGRKKEKKEVVDDGFKKPSSYTAMASRMFSRQAFKLADSGKFKQLNENLRKANMPYLLSTYLSRIFLSALLVFTVSCCLALLFAFFDISMIAGKPYPIFDFIGAAGLASRLLKNFFFSIAATLATSWLLYIYPSTQGASISGRIKGELPFVVMHMSSIAGSGVEPSRIFRILALSSEYPAVSKEMKKIVNYVNLYGYDLVNALRNVAKTTSNEKLSELFNGIATNIVGGGSLQNYLNKRSEDMLLDYKLDRKKYSSIAETSMDIYIGILIAAPLIFMVMLIVMSVTGIGFGMSIQMLSYLIIAGIALINIGFLIFLQARQPA